MKPTALFYLCTPSVSSPSSLLLSPHPPNPTHLWLMMGNGGVTGHYHNVNSTVHAHTHTHVSYSHEYKQHTNAVTYKYSLVLFSSLPIQSRSSVQMMCAPKIGQLILFTVNKIRVCCTTVMCWKSGVKLLGSELTMLTCCCMPLSQWQC